MGVLRFTSSGLVQGPTTLQMRLTRVYPGRMAAGAPAPARSLTDDEVLDNLRYFAVTLRGPRTRPCSAVVLSGVELADREGLAEVLDQGRRWGLERVVLHLGRGARHRWLQSPARRHVDGVVMAVAEPQDVHDLRVLAGEVGDLTAVVQLTIDGLVDLEDRVVAIAQARPSRVVLSWPMGGLELPPFAEAVRSALPGALKALAESGVPHGIKGLPSCSLGGVSAPTWRSKNRWYVDAEHQQDQALLFFPDVVRFVKTDECRFCSQDGACDGAPDTWLRAGRLPPPRAIRS